MRARDKVNIHFFQQRGSNLGICLDKFAHYRHKTERIARDIYIYIKTIEIRISRVLFIV